MSTADLIELAERLGGQRVLLLGDLMLDRYVYGDAERISPEAPVPVLRAVDEQERVGGSGSVAANLLAMGLEVSCCGVVGDDAEGRRLLALLKAAGASCDGILTVPGRRTTTKTRLVGLAQHRHRQQLLRFDQEDTHALPDAVVQDLLRHMTDLMADVDVICLEDYNKGLLGRAVIAAVVAAARRGNTPVLVDPAAIHDFERYRGVTLLTPNRMELSAALQRRFDDLDAMGRAAADLARQLQLEAMVVTVDRDGAILARADGAVERIATRPRSVYDNTGAGDAVLSMLASALAAGADLHQAVQLANVAGGLEVERFGCVPITKQEVLADLRIEHHRRIGKLRRVDDVVSELQLRRDRGETVAFTNGCFDLLHRGHVDYLQQAGERADVLVVGLNTDASVRRQRKGPSRPINTQENRAAVLAALEAVDYVVLFDDDTPDNLIQALKPDVLIKGADWADKGVVGRAFVEAYGGRVELLPLSEGHSTTALIERIAATVDARPART